jgi:hypothetical protein
VNERLLIASIACIPIDASCFASLMNGRKYELKSSWCLRSRYNSERDDICQMSSNGRWEVEIDSEYWPTTLCATTLSLKYLESICHESQRNIVFIAEETVVIADSIHNWTLRL